MPTKNGYRAHSLARLSREEMELLVKSLVCQLRLCNPVETYFALWGEWRRARLAIITIYRAVGLTPPRYVMDNEIPIIVPPWLQNMDLTSSSVGSDRFDITEAIKKLVQDMKLTGGSAVRSFDLYSVLLTMLLGITNEKER